MRPLAFSDSATLAGVTQVGAGGLDAGVPTGTVIGLFDDADEDGCILDYDITDAKTQVILCIYRQSSV